MFQNKFQVFFRAFKAIKLVFQGPKNMNLALKTNKHHQVKLVCHLVSIKAFSGPFIKTKYFNNNNNNNIFYFPFQNLHTVSAYQAEARNGLCA